MTEDRNIGEDDGEQQQEPSENDESVELTPEMQEELRRTIDWTRRSLYPKLDFKVLPQVRLIPDLALQNTATLSAFAEVQQGILSNVIKPFLDSQVRLRNPLVDSGIFNFTEAHQGTLSNAVKPLLEFQTTWWKPFINSDIFKIAELQQSNLNLIASRLTENIDFSLSGTLSKGLSEFATQQTSWLRAITPSLVNIRVRFYPSNLQDIEDLTFEQLEEVVMVDGIPLYGVPRTSTAEALIRADSSRKRRDILGRRWKTISADCREVVTACTTAAVAPYIPSAVAALDALDAGHTKAAQALAGSLIDAILSASFKKDRRRFTPDRKGKRTKDAYTEFSALQFIAFAPMWQAYQQFFVEDGDVVPVTFSRNATAHTVSPRQYNRRNAVQGLMFACSLLCRLDEEATARKAA